MTTSVKVKLRWFSLLVELDKDESDCRSLVDVLNSFKSFLVIASEDLAWLTIELVI